MENKEQKLIDIADKNYRYSNEYIDAWVDNLKQYRED